MELFYKILKTAVDGHASDVHVKKPLIIFRINRELIATNAPIRPEEWMNKVVANIVPSHLKKKIEEEREADFSYYVPNVGRFRTNFVSTTRAVVSCDALREDACAQLRGTGLLPQIRRIAESPRGIVLVAGFNRERQSTTLAAMIEHINSNAKKHIVTLGRPD